MKKTKNRPLTEAQMIRREARLLYRMARRTEAQRAARMRFLRLTDSTRLQRVLVGAGDGL